MPGAARATTNALYRLHPPSVPYFQNCEMSDARGACAMPEKCARQRVRVMRSERM